MAYAVPAQSIMEVAFEGEMDGSFVQSVFHYRFVSGTAITDGAAALAGMAALVQNANQLYDKWISLCSEQLVGCKIYTQWIKPTRYRQLVTVPASVTGQVFELANPINVAVAITKSGELASRHSIGTLHMPAVPITFIEASQLTNVAFDAYQVLANELDDEYVLPTGQTMQPVIFNRADYAASVRITNAVTQLFSRTMRRRTVGVGI